MKNYHLMKATKEGKLYYETEDFFQTPKVRETILKLLDSDIIKEIDRKRFEKTI